MMYKIDHLTLKLPPEFRGRERGIHSALAEALSRGHAPARSQDIAAHAINIAGIHTSQSDHAIGKIIAGRIHSENYGHRK